MIKQFIKPHTFNSKPQIIINNTEIHESLQSSKDQILNMIAKWISEGSGWTIESVDNHYLNIVQYQPMKGSSYIELPQELKHHRKGLIIRKMKIMNVSDGVISDISIPKTNILNE